MIAASISIATFSLGKQPTETPPSFGDEMVVNGDFSSAGDDWQESSQFVVSYPSGTCRLAASSTIDASITQGINGLEHGSDYQLKFDLVTSDANTDFLLEGLFGSQVLSKQVNAYTFNYTYDQTNGNDLIFKLDASFGGSGSVTIDNISLKKIT